MPIADEPLFPRRPPHELDPDENESGLGPKIQRLVKDQLYGVLCTQGHGQPYGSMVAFAFSEDLSYAVFTTPVATRKYRLLTECDHVALVVDNRPLYPNDMMKVEAVTATGKVTNVDRGPLFEEYARLLTNRHPQLGSFVTVSSCALFRIDVFRFFHVTRFQEVGQWVPPSHG